MNRKKENSIKHSCQILKRYIQKHRNKIIELLLEYESYGTAMDEITRTFRALDNIDRELKYILNTEVNYISVFFPINQPLYSMILFAIIPSFMCKEIFIRPSQLNRKLQKRIYNLLDLPNKHRNIKFITDLDKASFIEGYVSVSDVVIFVGKYENAQEIKTHCKDDVFFIYTGYGINPAIISEKTNLLKATEKIWEAKTYNNGQDCAAPDMIFVHQSRAPELTKRLSRKIKNTKIGSYHDRNIQIGKLLDINNLSVARKLFDQYKNNIQCGGIINYKSNIIYPTIIVNTLDKDTLNFTEFFSPIFYILTYKNTKELDLCFQNKNYLEYAMYVSIFGKIDYINNIKNTVILRGKTVNDVERNYRPYGGYGTKSGFVYFNNKYFHRPILISKEISLWQKNKYHKVKK